MVIPLILKMPVVLLLEKAVIYRLLSVRSNIIMRSVIVAFLFACSFCVSAETVLATRALLDNQSFQYPLPIMASFDALLLR